MAKKRTDRSERTLALTDSDTERWQSAPHGERTGIARAIAAAHGVHLSTVYRTLRRMAIPPDPRRSPGALALAGSRDRLRRLRELRKKLRSDTSPAATREAVEGLRAILRETLDEPHS